MRSSLRTAAVMLLVVPVVAGAAMRHLALKKSAPMKDETIAEAKDIKLWFTEKAELATTKVRVIHAAKDTVAVGKLTQGADKDAPIVAPIAKKLVSGAYMVEWSTMSHDGHPVKGSYGFTVKP